MLNRFIENERFVIPPKVGYEDFVPDPPSTLTLTTVQMGRYRIQNNSAAGYLVYIGVDEMPDLEGDDYTFQTTLPITIPHG